jgi:hypothetical protein
MTEQEVFEFCTTVSKLPAPDVGELVPTPQLFEDLLLECRKQSLAPDCFVVDGRVWSTLLTAPGFHELLDPVVTYDSVLAGHVSNLFGVPVVTDAYFSPYADVSATDSARIYPHRLFLTRVLAVVSGDKAFRAI